MEIIIVVARREGGGYKRVAMRGLYHGTVHRGDWWLRESAHMIKWHRTKYTHK